MSRDKLLAEWFWTDRWMGSSGFLLPMLARGVYREMLTQAWRRGAKLPNDHETVRRAIGATETEWATAWPIIAKYWRVDADNNLVNDTQLDVYAQALSLQSVRSKAGRLGGLKTQAKHQANGQANSQAEIKPPSPSPSPSLTPSPSPTLKPVVISKDLQEHKNGNGKSRKPIYQNERFAVHQWQVENLLSMLGTHADTFDLHEWLLVGAVKVAKRERGVVPDWWKWLKAQTVKEAQRRGLAMAATEPLNRADRDIQAMITGGNAFLARAAARGEKI